MKLFLSTALLLAAAATSPAVAVPIATSFAATGADKAAIEALLKSYTQAVSTKDQALFETLLLNKDVSFSWVDAGGVKAGAKESNYEGFRKAVFEGPAFTQSFQNISILNDQALATVSLVFVNTTPAGSDWGWKTMQLLKVDGRWKIASEFFTSH